MCAVRGRDLPPEDVRWIQKLFGYGFSWRRIARTTGFSFRTIHKYRKAMFKEKRRQRWERGKSLAKESAPTLSKRP
jgi:hypothetical protein